MTQTTWYHVTPSVNVQSILQQGLQPSKSGLDGPGVYLWRGPFAEALKEADISLTDNHYTMSEAEFMDFARSLSFLAVELPDTAAFSVEYPEYGVYEGNIPADRITVCGCFADRIEHKDKASVLFQDVFPGPISEALDDHFKEQGWELQVWQTEAGLGYQVYFGEGVQVDNLYEYGLQYLYDKDELLSFVRNFYATHCLCASIDESKITDTARISVSWDSFGVAVDFNYSYSEQDGYGEGVLCYCEPYADGTPDLSAWAEALNIGQCLKEKYGLPVDTLKDIPFLKEVGIGQIEIIDSYKSNNDAFYTVAVRPGFCVDVKVCSDTGLAYIMQNDDGSLVYETGNADHTYPSYTVNEQAVVQYVRAFHGKAKSADKPALGQQIQGATTRTKETRKTSIPKEAEHGR